jgi:hypothetical protein
VESVDKPDGHMESFEIIELRKLNRRKVHIHLKNNLHRNINL